MANFKNTTINDTEFLQLPSGNSAQRPSSPTAGMFRFNTELGYPEYFTGSFWLPIALSPITADGGDIIEDVTINGETFRVHAFTSTGQSTIEVSTTSNGQVDVLIVAGGGSGGGGGSGSHKGGGGGAGGLIFFPGLLLASGIYNISVGNGGPQVGAQSGGSRQRGINGENTTAFGLTAVGGGGGGREDGGPGQPGGSGGGGHYQASPRTGGPGVQPTQSNFSGQPYGFGNKGGNSTGSHGAGGGGAGARGRRDNEGTADGTIRMGRWAGGEGLSQVTIGGITYNFAQMFGTTHGEVENGQAWFAGGGGSGTATSGIGQSGAGGLGGGGAGAYERDGGGTVWQPGSSKGQPGFANTGGAGGGARDGLSGEGGSGIVIVRYRTG